MVYAPTWRGLRLELKDFNDCVNGVSGHEAGAGLALVKRAIDAAIAGETRPGAPPIITGDDEQDGKFSMTDSGLYRNKNKKWNWISQSFEILASRATWRSRAMHLLGGASLFASEIAMGRFARRSFPTERCTATERTDRIPSGLRHDHQRHIAGAPLVR